MEMNFSHWMALESAMQGDQPKRAFDRATLRRIAVLARPHRRQLVAFILLSVVGAVLTVATPVLAGRVVDEIVAGDDQQQVVVLALVIAGVALLEAAAGLAERWQSWRIGEGLILDLRRTVYRHVQQMPVAFFTRTRTGALVSRLDNDVIGAQRAFTWTLSGVVSNAIALLLALAVMLRLSWQITLLALGLLPVFVIPARRMGRRLAHLEREAADHNAAMTTQMTERFSAPGATLVKLFGDPEREASEFTDRADRVARIGVRTAMGQYTFLTALALVSALALALVYGLGGWLALEQRLDAGTVVTMGLLLAQLYSPLTALASARVDAMTAVVSFERVFEVLDLEPLIRERPNAEVVPPGPVSVEVEDLRFAYPSADKVSRPPSICRLPISASARAARSGRSAAQPASLKRFQASPSSASQSMAKSVSGSAAKICRKASSASASAATSLSAASSRSRKSRLRWRQSSPARRKQARKAERARSSRPYTGHSSAATSVIVA